MGKIFYVMGKSATGKDRLCGALREHFGETLKTLVSYTTRPIRSGETEGDPYHFISSGQLELFRKNGRIIEERTYQTVQGPWTYATVDDGSFRPEDTSFYLTVGTPESYLAIRAHYGAQALIPLYIQVEDGLRMERALARERAQAQPKYAELCRRYLADEADYAPEKLKELALTRRFENIDFDRCLAELTEAIEQILEAECRQKGGSL